MVRFGRLCVLGAVFLAASPSVLAQGARKEFAEHLSFLASDEMRGRGNYQPEIDIAAEYIADIFRRYGLEPGAGEEGYFQAFDLPVIARAGRRNSLSLRHRRLRIKQAEGDFKLIGYGEKASGRLEGELVFAGYGISAPELGYDDYRNIDTLGKIVLVMEHEPQENLHSSRFRGLDPTPYSSLRYKVANARQHGAAAVLIMPDSLHHPSWLAEDIADEHTQLERLGLPTFRVSEAWAKRFFSLSLSATNLSQLQQYIDIGPRPFSLPLGEWKAEIEIDVHETTQPVRNVLGLLPGSSDEVLIIGAHYDHVGLGHEGLQSPFQGEIHNGADDNASGTAGLLYLARRLSQGPPLQRSVLLIAFAGEELGLLGSRHFVQASPLDPSQVIAMFNMDMIGRSPGDLLLAGVGTAQEFQGLLSAIQMESPLFFKYAQTPQAPSDHLPFSSSWGIPVLYFSTGLHDQYHRPDDDVERIDVPRTLQILQVVESMVRRLDLLEERPRFVDLRGFPEFFRPYADTPRPLFGMMPDLNWISNGVRLEGVTEQTPAHEAGLRQGDILIGFDGAYLQSFSDFALIMSEKSPGEMVDVLALRQGTLIRSRVRLAAAELWQ